LPADTRDYYEVLGVERGASDTEIKKAFRRKARECHPDVNGASDAEDRFKAVNEAYDVLSDPAKKEQYDRFGTVGRSGGPSGYPYVDFGDLFGGGMGGGFSMEDLFGAFFSGVAGHGGRGTRLEGRDMAMGLGITLEEAARGVDKEIVLDRLAPCDICGGSGAKPGTGVSRCAECSGTGQKVSVRRTFLGTMQTAVPCDNCGATGQVVDDPCEECEGSGRVPDRQHVNISIPAGIHDGQQIRLRGMGEAGIRGAQGGDLIVTVRVEQHEFLHREGNDLHCKASVTITQATLGSRMAVCGLLEDNEIDVPAGTQHGDTVRLKGRGMPRPGGGGSRGDLIVHLGVEVPKKLTKKQRELLTELSSEFGDEQRAARSTLEKLRDWLTG
jgi:molecular chaperone DnaJ